MEPKTENNLRNQIDEKREMIIKLHNDLSSLELEYALLCCPFKIDDAVVFPFDNEKGNIISIRYHHVYNWEATARLKSNDGTRKIRFHDYEKNQFHLLYAILDNSDNDELSSNNSAVESASKKGSRT